MLLDDHRLNDLTGTILAGALEVHRVLGPGLLESMYQSCAQYELRSRSLEFATQQPIALTYKELRLDAAYRMDLVVEDLRVPVTPR